jgi:hypothetical protein
MGLDVRKNSFLYSVGTQLAYKIAKEYYGNIHYVWCTTEFNSLKQPPTSNPAIICKRYLEQITTGDRHTQEIMNNIAGILRGAKAKLDSGVINEKEYNKIRTIVSVARYEVFFPVLYIVDSKKVKDKCKEVKVKERASDDAIEYKIEDLKENEFEIILFKDIMGSVIEIVDKEVGE